MPVSGLPELVREGRLDEALAALQNAVRADPADAALRTALFQLLAVLGQWERALTQLNLCSDLDASNVAMTGTYRELIRCEAFRARVFAGRNTPLVFGEPPGWLAKLIEALPLYADTPGAAVTLRDAAFAEATSPGGTLNGEPFQWLADMDGRLGPVLEAVVKGRYYWIPFDRLRAVSIEAPADLRDFVWLPAVFTWANEGKSVGFIPARYPGSESRESPQVRLARTTEWEEPSTGLYLGAGQRMLSTDSSEVPLLEVREIQFTG